MVIVAWSGSLTTTSLGSEALTISIFTCSLPSNILSLVTEKLNEAIVTPLENVTLYGPEL